MGGPVLSRLLRASLPERQGLAEALEARVQNAEETDRGVPLRP